MKGKGEITKNNLFIDIKTLIEQSKQQTAAAVNSAMTMLYWQVGSRIKNEILKNKRAEYGQEIIKKLSVNLTEQYGKGWSEKHLRHCLRIAETFPNSRIVSTLWRQLSWSHIKNYTLFLTIFLQQSSKDAGFYYE